MLKWLLILVMPSVAVAYVPDLQMILDRTVKNQGNTGYIIDVEVTFDNKAYTQIVREQWIIEDAENIRMTARGEKDLKDKLSIMRVYDNNRRYFVDDSGAVKSNKASSEFFEPIFHIRTVKKMMRTLVDLEVLPESALKTKNKVIDIKEPVYDRPSYLRLSRAAGVITYALGIPPNKDANQSNPGLWIEQDQFVLRKLRLPTQAEISAEDYQKWANTLMFPQTRIVRWSGNSVKMRVINARNTPITPKLKEMVSSKAFFEEKKKNDKLNVLPDDPLIQEFYSRFR